MKAGARAAFWWRCRYVTLTGTWSRDRQVALQGGAFHLVAAALAEL
jgi:hypothetical protein